MAHAVRYNASDALITTLIDTYKTTTSSELRDDIAAALTATRNQDTAVYLSGLLTDKTVVRPQDFTHWYVWLLRNRYSKVYMWQWIRDNWTWVEKTFKEDASCDVLPRYIVASLRTPTQLTEYRLFGTAREKL